MKLKLLSVLLIGFLVVFVTMAVIARASSQSDAVIELNADYTWNYVGGTPTPWIITATPEMQPTNTLQPTSTETPLATATMPSSATPTQEGMLPTSTPFATSVPKVCTLSALGFNINARALPVVNAPVTGLWESGTEATFDKFEVNGIYMWGQHSLGWSVVLDIQAQNWWVAGTEAASLCTLVEGWPDGLQPPGAISRSDMVIGFFSMPNGNIFEMIEAGRVGLAKGIPFGVHVYSDLSICLQVIEAGGVCSYRPGAPDCPGNLFVDDPRQSARDFMSNVSYYADGVFQLPQYRNSVMIDVVNECGWGDDTRELSWWAEWMDEYITQASVRNWPPLQLPSLGPGYGNELMFSTWTDVLNKLAAHGGLFAMHVYNPVDTWLCPFNEWLADRTLHNYEIMQAQGINIRMSLTEVGQGWGNTPPNIDDMTCHAERHAGYPFIAQYYIWENGYNPTWANGDWEGHTIPFMDALDAGAWN